MERYIAQVRATLDRLEEIQADLAKIATRTDEARKLDMVHLRRDLTSQIALVGKTIEPVLVGMGDPALLATFRAKFAHMRSEAAIHQAKWPAVRLGESAAEYALSVLNVREANRDFINWTRHTFSEIKSPS
jgi:hypothetical protein